ncbi:uncharacterized protein LOC105189245 [Harpegnathos saltator]|uniref:uncharacterized protein LOC105189245 n=1 Tax=Harpegnathos saltator TaxID=610380 RepID=UPI000DBEE462|nr:uncharacterized protein LOC105189245 [Harpegnathos saltator]
MLLCINTSQSHNTFWISEYFVEQDRYFYLILLYVNAAFCIGMFTIAATGSMLLALLKHACGIFSVASYRLGQIMTTDARRNHLTHKLTIKKRIIHAVDIHCKAMEYSEFLISNFEGSFFLLIIFGVLCLSFNLFRIFQLVSTTNNMYEFSMRVLCASAVIIYMFMANYIGQQIVDHNEHVHFTAYNVQWYTASLDVQRMILFVLQRGSRIFGLHVGGLFVASLECFAAVKYLLEQLQEICNELKDENEIAIIKKYGDKAKHVTVFLTLLIVCTQVIIIVQPIWSRILGIFLFLNESRSRGEMFIVTEYFVDQQKYSHLVLLHINVAICIGLFAMIATGTMLLVFLKHACGMFSIASYRIKRAIANNMPQNTNLSDQSIICKKIICAVDIHRKAMQYSDFLISSFEGSFFLLIAFGVTSMSLNLFRLFQLALSGDNKQELLVRFICAILILLYMFLANEIGQEITDHNDQIYFTAYIVRWYTAPLHVQKLILFLIQRGSKPFGLHVGRLFVASLECFATLASASISYFTVMYSVQKTYNTPII